MVPFYRGSSFALYNTSLFPRKFLGIATYSFRNSDLFSRPWDFK